MSIAFAWLRAMVVDCVTFDCRDLETLPGGDQISWEGYRQTINTVFCHTQQAYPKPLRCANGSFDVAVENSAQFETITDISVLTVRTGRIYPAFVSASVEVPKEFNIALPDYGNSVNNKALMISCNDPKRPVLDPLSVELSPGFYPKGIISYFNMSFEHSHVPPMSGHTSDITIVFMAEMTLTAGDSIFFSLPKFGVDGAIPLSFKSNLDSLSSSLTWIPGMHKLKVDVRHTLRGSTHCAMTVSGIRLPTDGVQFRQPSLTISVETPSGPVDSQSITDCPAVFKVGAMDKAHLSFSSEATQCVQRFGGFDYPGFEVDRKLELPQLLCDIAATVSQDGSAHVSCSGPCCDRMPGQSVSSGPVDGRYGNDEICEWRLSSSSMFMLIFTRFNTEVDSDFIKIYGCDDEEMASLSGDLTGSTGTYSSQVCGVMRVVFTSDGSGTKNGFEAVTMLGSGRAAADTTLTFSFVPRMQLYATDTISLHLMNFMGSSPIINDSGTNMTATNDNAMNLTVSSSPLGLISHATWARETHTLTFTISRFLEAFAPAVVRVDRSYGIKLPIHGLMSNDPSLSISSSAGAGPFPQSKDITCDPVGSFRTSPRLSFPGGEPGKPSQIDLTFVTYHPMGLQEVLELHLPDFSGPTNRNFFVTSSPISCGSQSDVFGCSSKYTRASWSSTDSKLRLTMKYQETMEVGEMITIHVPSDANVAIPFFGILQNQLTFSISSNSAWGPFPRTSISNVDAVTLFQQRLQSVPCNLESKCPFPLSATTYEFVRPILSFDPPKAAEATSITVKLVTRYALSPGDIVEIDLEGFTPKYDIASVLIDTAQMRGNLSGSWLGTPSGIMKLRLTVLGDSLPMQIEFTIPKSSTIGLPTLGNVMNSQGNVVTIRQGSRDAYSSLECISPAVGVFDESRLDYDTCAGQDEIDGCNCNSLNPFSPSQISFSFQAVMTLYEGDTITLHLPGFSSIDLEDFTRYPITSSPSQAMLLASWNQNASLLIVAVAKTITKDMTSQFVLPISAGLRLPPNGTASGSSSLTSSTFQVDALHGMIPPTNIATSPAVPSIPSESLIRFDPSIPNEYMDIEFSFIPLFPKQINSASCTREKVVFRSGDSIILSLPTFRVDIQNEYHSRREPRIDPLGQNSSAIVIEVTSVPPEVIGEAQWFDDLKMLVFKVSKSLLAGNLVFINVPHEAGVTSGSEVGSNSPTHTISAIMDQFHVPAISIPHSDLIRAYGAVIRSSITFDPPSNLRVPNPAMIAIEIQFAVDLDLLTSDFVDILLPGFRINRDFAEGGLILVTSEPIICFDDPLRCEGSIVETFWFKSESRLSMRLQRSMPAYQNITVQIPFDAGLQVPGSCF